MKQLIMLKCEMTNNFFEKDEEGSNQAEDINKAVRSFLETCVLLVSVEVLYSDPLVVGLFEKNAGGLVGRWPKVSVLTTPTFTTIPHFVNCMDGEIRKHKAGKFNGY